MQAQPPDQVTAPAQNLAAPQKITGRQRRAQERQLLSAFCSSLAHSATTRWNDSEELRRWFRKHDTRFEVTLDATQTWPEPKGDTLQSTHAVVLRDEMQT